MPRGFPNKKIEDNLKNPIDMINNDSITSESTAEILPATPTDLADSTSPFPDSGPKKSGTKNDDLLQRYPSRTLEDLRKIDFVQQHQSKFPKVERPGFVISWICNTPNTDWRDIHYKQGYDYVPGIEPVASGYSDQTGEDRFAHYAMQIPVEIYESKQKATQDLTSKRFDHILKPKKEGTRLSRSESGMYDPEGRIVKTVNRVLTPEQE